MPDEMTPSERGRREIAAVLAGQNRRLSEIEEDLHAHQEDGEGLSRRLDAVEDRVATLLAAAGLTMPDSPAPEHEAEGDESRDHDLDWDTLVRQSGVDINSVELDQLLDPKTASEIGARFDAPLSRLPWDRWDYLVVFGASLVGVVADWFCGPLGNPVAEKLRSYGSELHDKEGLHKKFSQFQGSLGSSSLADRFEWVRRLADMDVRNHNLPIDFCGTNFGGQHHRALSPGHDLLRFLSGIWQIKSGQFVGTRFENNVPIMVLRTVSHRGTPYREAGGWMEAAVEYLLHLAADFFTKTSLPIPGWSFLRESGHREVRRFAMEMYKGINPLNPTTNGHGHAAGGYNLRHALSHGVAPAVTGLIIWLYDVLRYRLPRWIARLRGKAVAQEPIPGLRYNEMRAAAHTTVAAINVGKVVVMQNPLLLNLPQLIVASKALLGLTLKQLKRYDLRARIARNRVYLDEGWAQLESELSADNRELIRALPKKPIVLH